MLFFGKFFRTTILFIAFLEILSFFGYLFPVFNSIVFGVLVVLFVIIAWQKLDWALYVLLAELFIGSKGYLFYYSFSGQKISIRIAFWLVIMLVWVVRVLYGAYWRQGERVIKKGLVFKIKHIICNIKSSLTPQPPLSGGLVALPGFFAKLRVVKNVRFFQSSLAKYFLLFFIAIAWSLLIALLRHNQLSIIFNDFNAFLYFGLIFIFYDVITDKQKVGELMQVFMGSMVAMTLKTFALLYFFSHQFFGIKTVYRWIRTSGVGEITMMGDGYYRIFFQSHFFAVIGLLMIIVFLLFGEYKITKDKIVNFAKYHLAIALLSLGILLSAISLISLSRSFWLGFLVSLVLLLVFYLIYNQFTYKKFIIYSSIIFLAIAYLVYIYSQGHYLNIALALLVVFILITQFLPSKNNVYFFLILMISLLLLSFSLIRGVVQFPWPRPGVVGDLSGVFGDRASLEGDSATGSRWNLLKPLSVAIFKFPTVLTGDGFGQTVTYFSQDPRVLEKNPTGEYTTYAFEWGYLDLWLKFGLVGLIIYLILLFKIFWLGWSGLIRDKLNMEPSKNRLVLGLLFGVIFLTVVHGFTPYLNHPLGIGYLMMCAVVFEVFRSENS